MIGRAGRACAIVTLLLAAGCFRNTLYVSGMTPELERSEWRHHALFGLISFSEDIDLRELCPQGIARVETRQDALNVLVSVLTIGIYTPSQVVVVCQAIPPRRPPEATLIPESTIDSGGNAIGSPEAGASPASSGTDAGLILPAQ